MSSIKKTETGRWRARWRTPDGASRMKTFDRKIDADLWLTGIDHEKASGAYIDPKAGVISFRDFAEQWRLSQVHRPSTAEQVETMLRNHAYPAFGAKPLKSIRHSELQAWVKGLDSKLAPATIEVAARHVVSVFRAAAKDRLLAVSPADDLKLPKAARAEIVPLTVDEVLQIADSIQSRYAALVMLIAGTGLRPAEAFGLTNDRVDWIPKQLRVDRQMVTVGGVANFGPPKTDSSVRTIPMPTFIVEQLAAHVEQYGLGDHELIFSDASSRPIRRNRFGEVWRQAMKPLDFDRKGRTSFATTTPRCSSSTANPSRSCRNASATHQQPKPSTPTHTYGLARMN